MGEMITFTSNLEDGADRFAAEGFTALAPDQDRGQSSTEPDATAWAPTLELFRPAS